MQFAPSYDVPLVLVSTFMAFAASSTSLEAFLRAAIIAFGAGGFVVLLGSILFIRFTAPMVSQIKLGGLFESVIESVPHAMFLTDPNGTLRHVNHAFERLFEYDRADVISQLRPHDLMHAEDGEKLERLSRVAAPVSAELRALTSAGQMRWVRLSRALMRNAPGSRIYTAEDITAAKEVERARQEAEQRYRELVERSSDLMFWTDPFGKLTYINAAGEQIHGRKREELIGHHFGELVDAESAAKGRAAFARVAAGETIRDLEIRPTTASGETIYLSISASPVYDEEGHLTGTHGIGRDVTQRVREKELAEERLREHSLLRSLINGTPDVIFVKDMDGIYRSVNSAFSELIGKPEEEIIGRTDWELYPRAEADQYAASDRAMFESGKPTKSEAWVQQRDGRRVLLDTLKMPYFGPDGSRYGMIGIARDVTDRKRIEEQLERAAAPGPLTPDLLEAAPVGKRILLAEDNAVNQQVAAIMLRHRGHVVDVVENGRDALHALQTAEYDVVLMDVQMPEMDGLHATRRIREMPRYKKLPIIALSAHALAEERQLCLDSGMNAFLSKPFRPRDLFSMVEGWTNAEQRETGAGNGKSNGHDKGNGKSNGYGNGNGTVPPVQLDEFRKVMREAGVEDIVVPTIQLFREETPGRLESLRRANAEGDLAEAASSAHAIKSAARNIHAVALSEHLESLERSAKAGDPQATEAAYSEVEREFERVLAYLDTMR